MPRMLTVRLAAFTQLTYQLAGQPDLAEPYFETAKEQLKAASRRSEFPGWEVPQAHATRAGMTAGLGDFDEARRIAEESMAMKFPDEPMITKRFFLRQPSVSSYPREIMIALLNCWMNILQRRSDGRLRGCRATPQLDPIRDHPGWLALVEKYKRQ